MASSLEGLFSSLLTQSPDELVQDYQFQLMNNLLSYFPQAFSCTYELGYVTGPVFACFTCLFANISTLSPKDRAQYEHLFTTLSDDYDGFDEDFEMDGNEDDDDDDDDGEPKERVGHVKGSYLHKKLNDPFNILPLFGVCLGCAQTCHKGHSLYYIGIINHFRCDCGTLKAPSVEMVHAFEQSQVGFVLSSEMKRINEKNAEEKDVQDALKRMIDELNNTTTDEDSQDSTPNGVSGEDTAPTPPPKKEKKYKFETNKTTPHSALSHGSQNNTSHLDALLRSLSEEDEYMQAELIRLYPNYKSRHNFLTELILTLQTRQIQALNPNAEPLGEIITTASPFGFSFVNFKGNFSRVKNMLEEYQIINHPYYIAQPFKTLTDRDEDFYGGTPVSINITTATEKFNTIVRNLHLNPWYLDAEFIAKENNYSHPNFDLFQKNIAPFLIFPEYEQYIPTVYGKLPSDYTPVTSADNHYKSVPLGDTSMCKLYKNKAVINIENHYNENFFESVLTTQAPYRIQKGSLYRRYIEGLLKDGTISVEEAVKLVFALKYSEVPPNDYFFFENPRLSFEGYLKFRPEAGKLEPSWVFRKNASISVNNTISPHVAYQGFNSQGQFWDHSQNFWDNLTKKIIKLIETKQIDEKNKINIFDLIQKYIHSGFLIDNSQAVDAVSAFKCSPVNATDALDLTDEDLLSLIHAPRIDRPHPDVLEKKMRESKLLARMGKEKGDENAGGDDQIATENNTNIDPNAPPAPGFEYAYRCYIQYILELRQMTQSEKETGTKHVSTNDRNKSGGQNDADEPKIPPTDNPELLEIMSQVTGHQSHDITFLDNPFIAYTDYNLPSLEKGGSKFLMQKYQDIFEKYHRTKSTTPLATTTSPQLPADCTHPKTPNLTSDLEFIPPQSDPQELVRLPPPTPHSPFLLDSTPSPFPDSTPMEPKSPQSYQPRRLSPIQRPMERRVPPNPQPLNQKRTQPRISAQETTRTLPSQLKDSTTFSTCMLCHQFVYHTIPQPVMIVHAEKPFKNWINKFGTCAQDFAQWKKVKGDVELPNQFSLMIDGKDDLEEILELDPFTHVKKLGDCAGDGVGDGEGCGKNIDFFYNNPEKFIQFSPSWVLSSSLLCESCILFCPELYPYTTTNSNVDKDFLEQNFFSSYIYPKLSDYTSFDLFSTCLDDSYQSTPDPTQYYYTTLPINRQTLLDSQTVSLPAHLVPIFSQSNTECIRPPITFLDKTRAPWLTHTEWLPDKQRSLSSKPADKEGWDRYEILAHLTSMGESMYAFSNTMDKYNYKHGISPIYQYSTGDDGLLVGGLESGENKTENKAQDDVARTNEWMSHLCHEEIERRNIAEISISDLEADFKDFDLDSFDAKRQYIIDNILTLPKSFDKNGERNQQHCPIYSPSEQINQLLFRSPFHVYTDYAFYQSRVPIDPIYTNPDQFRGSKHNDDKIIDTNDQHDNKNNYDFFQTLNKNKINICQCQKCIVHYDDPSSFMSYALLGSSMNTPTVNIIHWLIKFAQSVSRAGDGKEILKQSFPVMLPLFYDWMPDELTLTLIKLYYLEVSELVIGKSLSQDAHQLTEQLQRMVANAKGESDWYIDSHGDDYELPPSSFNFNEYISIEEISARIFSELSNYSLSIDEKNKIFGHIENPKIEIFFRTLKLDRFFNTDFPRSDPYARRLLFLPYLRDTFSKFSPDQFSYRKCYEYLTKYFDKKNEQNSDNSHNNIDPNKNNNNNTNDFSKIKFSTQQNLHAHDPAAIFGSEQDLAGIVEAREEFQTKITKLHEAHARATEALQSLLGGNSFVQSNEIGNDQGIDGDEGNNKVDMSAFGELLEIQKDGNEDDSSGGGDDDDDDDDDDGMIEISPDDPEFRLFLGSIGSLGGEEGSGEVGRVIDAGNGVEGIVIGGDGEINDVQAGLILQLIANVLKEEEEAQLRKKNAKNNEDEKKDEEKDGGGMDEDFIE